MSRARCTRISSKLCGPVWPAELFLLATHRHYLHHSRTQPSRTTTIHSKDESILADDGEATSILNKTGNLGGGRSKGMGFSPHTFCPGISMLSFPRAILALKGTPRHGGSSSPSERQEATKVARG